MGKSTIREALVESDQFEQEKLKLLSTSQSKPILRRKGYFDVTPVVANKRVLVVGIHPNDGYPFYLWHDLLAKGIPFHVCTYTFFLTNYNTSKWKSNYDIIFFGGTYATDEPAATTPAAVKTAVQAIIAGGLYKILQVSTAGMKRLPDINGGTYADAYWFADLGCTVAANGSLTTNTFDTVNGVSVADQAPSMLASDGGYKAKGVCENASGPSLTALNVLAAPNQTHCVCSGDAARKWAVIGGQGGNDNPYNSIIDHGKVVGWLRNIKSGIAFNMIDGHKYIAAGIDCDITTVPATIDKIRTIFGNKPLELGLVTQKLTPELAKYYQGLQAQGVKIVSHTFSHFDVTNPAQVPYYEEYDRSLEDLDRYGLVSDGVIYMTLDYLNPEHWRAPIDNGWLMNNYRSIYRGRCYGAFIIAELGYTSNTNSSSPPTSVKTDRLCPIFGVSLKDDIQNMRDNGVNAYTQWVSFFNRADQVNYEQPLIFYFHDKPLNPSWNDGMAGTYYDSANADYMAKRTQYYTDIFSFIDNKLAAGYVFIKRSTAIELIYDIINCVSISSEVTNAAGAIKDNINNAPGYTAADTTFNVLHGSYFVPGQVVLIESTNEKVLITAVNNNTLTVTRAYGGTIAAAIANNAVLNVQNNTVTKVVSSRRINGLTVRVPNDNAKNILSVVVEGIVVDSSKWTVSADKKLTFVGMNVVAGKEHTVVVNYV